MDLSPSLIDGVAAATLYRDRDEIEQSLVELFLQFLNARHVALYRIAREAGKDRAEPRIVAAREAGQVVVRRDGTPMELAQLPAWRLCIDENFPKSHALETGEHETIFPMADEEGQTTGLLHILGPKAADPRDLYLIGGIIRIIRNHLALIDYGERDTLTGLLNRKTLETQFEKLRAERRHSPDAAETDKANWIGLVDVDRFKSINDRLGHVFGDEVLLLVSQIIQRNFRGADRVYRFGGEEFVILLQDAPEGATAAALERLRAAVEKHPFPQLDCVTVSIGWTRIKPQDAPANAMERADAALYHAKHTGRNRVCHYESLLAAGELKASTQQAPPDVEFF